ncbi:MAG: hypothetical protein RIF32_12540 [Leptospirales bacterium]|jgi:hypothetical protein
MYRIRPGGTSAFQPTTRPNVFSDAGPEELINRRGESAFYFRFQPCPCPEEQRSSACVVCSPHTGLIKTFQESTIIQGEKPAINGKQIIPRWGPVLAVDRLYYKLDGEEIPLTIRRVHRDAIDIVEELEYWRAVYIDYRVSLIEELIAEGAASADFKVRLNLQGIIVQVVDVRDAESGIVIPHIAHTFDSIVFAKRQTGPVRARVRVINPIRVGYSTLDIEESNRRQGRIALKLEQGEIMFVVPHSVKMGEGDIVTLLRSDRRAQVRMRPHDGGDVDRLEYGPIKSILSCYGRNRGDDAPREYKEGRDFVVAGYDTIRWLAPRPEEGYSLMYLYHPGFRITGAVTIGSGMDRDAPRMYRGKAISSYAALD